ncbi:hypothetical protein [Fulvivirga sediminis]|uniref:Uncharacterized protein n=1 Tax=Fulvivirga sediminis TaxID=2803949 RepID=A0A937JYS5_9BACT|nr:hypothetical protein [Fulvivirga sediminis]MBL3656708.1 hypothetical protein [Fulvivirga sediminis]
MSAYWAGHWAQAGAVGAQRNAAMMSGHNFKNRYGKSTLEYRDNYKRQKIWNQAYASGEAVTYRNDGYYSTVTTPYGTSLNWTENWKVQDGPFNRVDLRKSDAGEQLMHNLRKLWDVYENSGQSGTYAGSDLVDPETMSWQARKANWGGLQSHTKTYIIAGENVIVNVLDHGSKRRVFGSSLSSISTPGVAKGKYVGDALGANVHFSWGPVHLTIHISKGEMYNSRGAQFNDALKFMNNLKGYIQGYNTGLNFQTPYPY